MRGLLQLCASIKRLYQSVPEWGRVTLAHPYGSPQNFPRTKRRPRLSFSMRAHELWRLVVPRNETSSQTPATFPYPEPAGPGGALCVNSRGTCESRLMLSARLERSDFGLHSKKILLIISSKKHTHTPHTHNTTHTQTQTHTHDTHTHIHTHHTHTTQQTHHTHTHHTHNTTHTDTHTTHTHTHTQTHQTYHRPHTHRHTHTLKMR